MQERLKESGVPGREVVRLGADDGKRSEAEWTLCNAGIEERGVPGGEGTAIIPDGRPADRLKNGPKNGSSF